MDITKRGNFYEFSQNNTGGSFTVNDKLCHRLFIEAPSLNIACSIAEELGCYWEGVQGGIDCGCCGDRWSKPWSDEPIKIPQKDKGFGELNSIEEYAQKLANEYGWTEPDARIFYMDGKVKEIFKRKKI